MKKLFLLLLISFYSFAQTSFILDGTGSTSRNNLTLPGYALGITGTTTGPYGIKGIVGLLPITTSGISTITGSGNVSVKTIVGGYNISVPGSVAGSTPWGSITGSILNQTDLQASLVAKRSSFFYNVTSVSSIQTYVDNISAGNDVNIFFPNTLSGFIITTPITISGKNNVNIYGEGGIIVNSTGGIAFKIQTCSTFTWQNLHINLNSIPGQGIALYSIKRNIRIQNSTFFNYQISSTGIYLSNIPVQVNADAESGGVVINNCFFYNGFDSYNWNNFDYANNPCQGIGIIFDDKSEYFLVEGNHFTSIGVGVWLRNGANGKIVNNVFMNNYPRWNSTDYGTIYCDPSGGEPNSGKLQVLGNTFNHNWSYAIKNDWSASPRPSLYANNQFISNGNTHIQITGATNNRIQNNYFNGAQAHINKTNDPFTAYNGRYILLSNSPNNLITANYFVGTTSSSYIFISGTSNNNKISDNWYDTNTLTGATLGLYVSQGGGGIDDYVESNEKTVFPKVTAYTHTSADNKRYFSNGTATSAVVFTLPTASLGTEINYLVTSSQFLTINSGTGSIIFDTNSGSSSSTISSSVTGNTLTLVCSATNTWYVKSAIGGWSVNGKISANSTTSTTVMDALSLTAVHSYLFINTTSGVLISLPDASVIPIDKEYHIENRALTNTTVTAFSGQSFAGLTSIIVSGLSNFVKIKNIGSGWRVIGSNLGDIINNAIDANYTTTIVLAEQTIKLPIITANRTISLPIASVSSGMVINIWNQNTSTVFGWTFASTVIDGVNTITGIFNGNKYILKSDGINWYVLSKTNPIFTATLDFPSTSSGATSDLTIGAVGASLSDAIILGVPNSSVPASGNIGIYSAWVSAADIITVRLSNGNTLNAIDPASGQFKITLLK